jgi:hypothetical protein
MTGETRYQRVAREQAERQAVREKRFQAETRGRMREAAIQNRIARQVKHDRAYEDWCTSDFPNQGDN